MLRFPWEVECLEIAGVIPAVTYYTELRLPVKQNYLICLCTLYFFIWCLRVRTQALDSFRVV